MTGRYDGLRWYNNPTTSTKSDNFHWGKASAMIVSRSVRKFDVKSAIRC